MSNGLQTVELKEKISHGDMLFPIERYYIDYSDDLARLYLHWHDEAEWTLIVVGEAVYQVDGQEYRVKAGDMLFVPPSALHMMNVISDRVLSDSLVFDLSWLSNGPSDVCFLKYLLPLGNGTKAFPVVVPSEHPLGTYFSDAFKKMCDCFSSRREGFELELKAMLLEVIHAMYSRGLVTVCAQASRGTGSERIKAILQYIEDNYSENVPISEIASHFGFSEYHFMRYFKKNVGMTCIEYINNLRLTKAYDMLETSNKSVTTVAFETGFNSPSYFCRMFRKKYGIAPSAIKHV